MAQVDIPLVVSLNRVNQIQSDPSSSDPATVSGPIYTVDQLFSIYEAIIDQIPAEGATKSHRYLVERGASILGISLETPDYTELQEEIAQLRQTIFSLDTSLYTLTHVDAS